ncbi:glycoside hydrolase family 5 protein [Blastococcus sp. SYSU DS0753]
MLRVIAVVATGSLLLAGCSDAEPASDVSVRQGTAAIDGVPTSPSPSGDATTDQNHVSEPSRSPATDDRNVESRGRNDIGIPPSDGELSAPEFPMSPQFPAQAAKPKDEPRAEEYVYLRGVNTQGGGGSQHDPSRVPGTRSTDYHWNSARFYDYLYSRGHRMVRLDFLWERVQRSFRAPLHPEGIAELQRAVQTASDAGLLVLLDMKNYGRYWLPNDEQVMFGAGISAEDFADVWQRLATVFADDGAVIGFGLMNEPWGLPPSPSGSESTVWKRFSQAAVDAIRTTGDTRAIFVAGDEWGGAWNWSGINGEPWISDAVQNIVYEAHVYFDSDTSGTYANSYIDTEMDAVARGWPTLEARVRSEVENFTTWLDTYDQQGFIGEIGWPSGPEAESWNDVGNMVYELLNEANVGAAYWAAGEWLSEGALMYRLDAYDRAYLRPQTQAAIIEAPSNLSIRR